MRLSTGQSQTTTTRTGPADTTTRPCLRCDSRSALAPYLYCRPCTIEAHLTRQRASQREALTKPPVKVYHWDTTKNRWVQKD